MSEQTLPDRLRAAMHLYLADLEDPNKHHEVLIVAANRIEELEREKERLEAWLLKIDGGDTPCTDEAQLRQWAYEAVTLRKPAQEQQQ